MPIKTPDIPIGMAVAPVNDIAVSRPNCIFKWQCKCEMTDGLIACRAPPLSSAHTLTRWWQLSIMDAKSCQKLR